MARKKKTTQDQRKPRTPAPEPAVAQPAMAKGPPPQTTTPQSAAPPAEPPELQDLRKTSAGLMYPSENDSPFDSFWWPAAGKGAVPGQMARDQVAAHAK